MSSSINRIIDANLNRAVEGVRVMEEVVRFVLNDKKLTKELKLIRSKLRQTGKGIGLSGRQALKDVGGKIYTKSEARRASFLDIFTANAKRVQEALRVLEEFSKLIKPNLGRSFKNVRFKIYDIEQKASQALSRRARLDFDLYVVTDPMRDHVAVAKKAVAGGVKALQLRDKSVAKKKMLGWARQIRMITKRKGVTFIVNDYPDIAREVKADGVHLGQEDLKRLPVSRTRKILGEEGVIGVSTHSFSQAVKAEKAGADYISVGPVFATASKPRGKPVGLRLLGKVLRRVKVPVVAIGGINESNIYNVAKTGCQRIAVIRAVLGKKDMRKAVVSLRRTILKLR